MSKRGYDYGPCQNYVAHMRDIAIEPDIYVSYTCAEAGVPVEKQAETIRRV